MKETLHPKWYSEASVTCACGNSWTTGATVSEIRTDICSRCHPFYTGEQRIVDTEGQVDRFMKRLQIREERLRTEQERIAALTSPERPLDELSLGKRYLKLFAEHQIETVGQFIERIEGGEESLLEIPGIGRKVLADAKRELRTMGYELPEGV